jgi:hypothetical protein
MYIVVMTREERSLGSVAKATDEWQTEDEERTGG